MNEVKIWIDADSCPRTVRQYVFRRAKVLKTKVLFVANRIIPADRAPDMFEMVVCKKEQNAADDVIVQNATNTDMVITRDVPLAARLVQKGVCVMNDRGTLFTRDNIKEKLSDRDFDLQLAQIGFGGRQCAAYGKKEIAAFKTCFEKAVQKQLRIAKMASLCRNV